jgi:threonine dehydrogenase-like Zn-dependent dehydrogenase
VPYNIDSIEAVKKLTDIKCDIIGTDQLQDDWVATKGLIRRLGQIKPTGFDAIIDFTPNGTDIYQIVFALATYGTFVHMGGNLSVFPVPLLVIMVNCWNIVGTRNHSRQDVKAVLQWLGQGLLNVDDLITHRYKLDDIKNAVVMLQERSEPAWMIVVNP